MASINTKISSFNGYPQQNSILHRPERARELLTIKKPCIARGLGKSYGDAALNENGHIVLMERLNRFIDFDSEQGLLTAETGVTLAEILNLIVPKNWFLPVTPGTQYLTLGGCIAADVHGKNHHRVGSFSDHIRYLDLISADGNSYRCDHQNHTDLFRATIGGLGLTGIISSVCIKLQPITNTSMTVVYHATNNLNQTIDALSDKTLDDAYSVAWLDTFKFGRGIVMTAHHSTADEVSKEGERRAPLPNHSNFTIPFHAPKWLLNQTSMKLFNELYFRMNKKKTKPIFMPYQNYFYPLDKINHWNRLYGKQGFIQYQCVIPDQNAAQGVEQLLNHLQKTAYPVFLAVLKRLGKQSQGLLSFPMPGLTLAVDLPIINAGLFNVLNELDDIVLKNQGRVYLAKDARLSPEAFRSMYPDYPKFQAIKHKIDPENYFSSSLSRRLGI